MRQVSSRENLSGGFTEKTNVSKSLFKLIYLKLFNFLKTVV